MNKDTVTVIKSVNYSEADKVLTVFGKNNGKYSLFAKSIRKIASKNRGNMQTLWTSNISFYEGKGMPVLTESELISNFDYESKDFDISNAQRVLFLLNNLLQEYDPYPEMFELLQNILEKGLSTESVNKFRLKFLKEAGFLQDLTVCNSCGQKKGEYIDLKNFTLVCKNCYSSKDKLEMVSKDLYSKDIFSKALDRYVKRVIEGT
jgi:DNA repair protein RecO (recombination protein O)